MHAKDSGLNTQNIARNGVLDAKSYRQMADRSWLFCTVGWGHDEIVWRQIASALRLAGYDSSRLRSFAETERMAQHLPNTRFAILEDCGHMAPLERPIELTALLASWIEEADL